MSRRHAKIANMLLKLPPADLAGVLNHLESGYRAKVQDADKARNMPLREYASFCLMHARLFASIVAAFPQGSKR